MMAENIGTAIDPICFEALKTSLARMNNLELASDH